MSTCEGNKTFCCLLSDTARLLRKHFDERVKVLGVTRAQWSVLVQLRRHEGLSQSELAELVEIEQPSLVRLLDKLEEGQLIARKPDEQDRRTKRVFLAPKSAEILEPLGEIAFKMHADVLTGLSETEQQALIALLGKVKTNLLTLETEKECA